MLLHPLLPLLLLSLCCSAANNVRVQFTHGLVKLRPGEAPPPCLSIRSEHTSGIESAPTGFDSRRASRDAVARGNPTASRYSSAFRRVSSSLSSRATSSVWNASSSTESSESSDGEYMASNPARARCAGARARGPPATTPRVKLEDESSDNSENQAGNKKMGDIKLYNRPIMTHQGSKLLSNENQEQTTKQRNNN